MTNTLSEHILVVEDDAVSRTILTDYFRKAGYQVSEADSREKASTILSESSVDLILLDITLVGRDDGLELTRQVRAASDLAIILISSRDSDIDRIIGLEMGADDYVVKPFNTRELLARVKNLLRRSVTPPEVKTQRVLCFNGWRLESSTRRLTDPNGSEVKLTNGEFLLLNAFLRRPGWVLNRDQLMDAVSSRDWMPTDRTIDVMVGRLRRKLENDPARPEMLRTVHGVGYQFMIESRTPTTP